MDTDMGFTGKRRVLREFSRADSEAAEGKIILPVELSRDRLQSAEFPAGETRGPICFSVAPIAAFDSRTDPLGDAFGFGHRERRSFSSRSTIAKSPVARAPRD